MTDIDDMIQDVEDLRSHGPHETSHYSALAMAGEVGELCNFVKKELRNPNVNNIVEIEKEVPDILFYLLQFCTDRRINIVEQWDKKMKHNAEKYGRILSRFTSGYCFCYECVKRRGDIIST